MKKKTIANDDFVTPDLTPKIENIDHSSFTRTEDEFRALQELIQSRDGEIVQLRELVRQRENSHKQFLDQVCAKLPFAVDESTALSKIEGLLSIEDLKNKIEREKNQQIEDLQKQKIDQEKQIDAVKLDLESDKRIISELRAEIEQLMSRCENSERKIEQLTKNAIEIHKDQKRVTWYQMLENKLKGVFKV